MLGVETHPAFHEESRRLTGTLGEVQGQLSHLKSLPAPNMPDLVDDAMISMLAAELRLYRMRLGNIRRLELASREPYFGRLDFQESGQDDVAPLYIGKVGVQRQQDYQPEVVDWRAPVATLFYTSASGGLDDAAYQSPEGVIRGSVWLKRHLGIKQGLLQRIVDSRVKGAPDEAEPILDEFLRYRLQESRDSRLRDIVSSIQAEQNAIIRAPMDRPLIIQGVAGSGKTTVALHRLAYLLYTFRDTVVADRIIIFAPNRMFLDYISDVLPELGVDGVVQTTFVDWALKELGEPIRLVDPAPRFARLFAPGKDPSAGGDAPGRFKGSLFFQDVLDLALATYEERFVPEHDLILWEGVRLRAATVAEWFESYRHYPIITRKERCIARARKWTDDQLLPFMSSEKGRERRKVALAQLRKWMKLWPAHSAFELYREIMGGKPGKGKAPALVGDPDIPERVIRETLPVLKEDEAAPEDLAPLVYLKGRLRGYRDDRQLDHVVIDEAQDFSPFQVDLLKRLTRENSFTILGDLSQGIHAYQGIERWDELAECFEQEAGYYTLEQSYRSTYEVMMFANQVIDRVGAPAPLAKPVFRSGEPVRVHTVTPDGLAPAIADEVATLRSRNCASIAVLARTEADAERLHGDLVGQGQVAELITPNQTTYQGGLSVMPVYLTKGLEFDAVIVTDASREAYGLNSRDAKLLYVACTRALHELVLFHTGDPSPLIQ